MNVLEAVFLGIVQGATEFLPVSSSGHLVLLPWLLNIAEPGLAFSAILHWGTVFAVLVFFREDLMRILAAGWKSLGTRSLEDADARLGWWIVIGTIPAVVLGLLFKDVFEQLFGRPRTVALFLIATAGLLFVSERISEKLRSTADLNWRDAILIGLAQALAITPGISRSGATIAAGLVLGLRREDATRYSFLLGIPAILGAGLLSLLDLFSAGMLSQQWPGMLGGFLAAAFTGYMAIRWLLSYVRNHSLNIFAFYCVLAGCSMFVVSLLRG